MTRYRIDICSKSMERFGKRFIQHVNSLNRYNLNYSIDKASYPKKIKIGLFDLRIG